MIKFVQDIPQSYLAVKAVVAQLSEEDIAAAFALIQGGGTDPAADARAAAAREQAARGELTLSNLRGLVLFDFDRQVPVLLDFTIKNGTRRWRLTDQEGRRRPISRGQRFLDPSTRELFSVGPMFGGQGQRDWRVTRQELDATQVKNYLGTMGLDSSIGSGASESQRDYMAEIAAQNASQEAIAAANRAHEIELERMRRERELELEQLREANALKRTKISEAGGLARTAAELKQRTREWLARTEGVDPFRASIGGQGGVQRGLTPAQAHRENNLAFANQPIPTVDENMQIPELQQTINSLNDMQQAPVMPALGFARGGSVYGRGMADGGQTLMGGPTFGTNKTAVLTGERNWDGDEEVIISDPTTGRVEVIPLTQQGMAEGGMFDTKFNFDTIKGALAPIYSSMGFKDVPTFEQTPYGIVPGGLAPGSGLSPLDLTRRLGYNPRILRVAGANPYTYFVNAQGQLQFIPGGHEGSVLKGLGLNEKDLMYVAPTDIEKYAQGAPALTSPPPLVEGGPQTYPQRSIPLFTPADKGSVALPDITQLAGIWRYLDPDTEHALASAYGVSGLGGGTSENPVFNALERIKRAVKFFTPAGTATRSAGAFG